MLAQLERAQIAKARLRDGWARTAENGGDAAGTHHSGTRPTTNGQLVPHNRETEGLGTIRALHADGRSIRAICDRLNADGIPAKRRGRCHLTTVARTLARETS